MHRSATAGDVNAPISLTQKKKTEQKSGSMHNVKQYYQLERSNLHSRDAIHSKEQAFCHNILGNKNLNTLRNTKAKLHSLTIVQLYQKQELKKSLNA